MPVQQLFQITKINLVRGARLVESISEVNFPQNGSHSSILPLNFVMDNLGSFVAEDDLHSSVAWVAAFCCSRFFSNSAFCSKIFLSNSVYDDPTLFSPAPPYLSLRLPIELYLLLGQLSRDVYRILRSMFLSLPRSLPW